MADRVVVDPITRIEGHLRIELETTDKMITKAWSEATQFRGLETILHGHDPRDAWAFVQRICGVCTGVHAIASVTAVEHAIGSNPPAQARLIRDLVLSSHDIQDHVIHFYHLHALDWVNVATAADADPAKTVEFARSIGSTWKGNTIERMAEVKSVVQGILASGQLSIFTGGYWSHPDYRLPAEANLMAVAHYLDALEFQRSMIRISTTFGGKNPHPNFLVGGMACSIDPDRSESINQVQLDNVKKWIDETKEFVETCYLPDARAIVGVYNDYFDIGASSPTLMAVGLAGATFHGDPKGSREQNAHTVIQPGIIELNGDVATFHEFDVSLITESTASAWYANSVPLKPAEGETKVEITGVPKPPYGTDPATKFLGDSDKYTWSKAPRYGGKPVQVGPVARVLSAYVQGHALTKEIVDGAIAFLAENFNATITLGKLNSTAGRTLARAVECQVSVGLMTEAYNALVAGITKGDIDVFDSTKWEPSSWPADCSGYSFVEVARGTLSHWITIKNGAIDRYQAVVPSTWLSGGRDENGYQGPYEESLAGNGQHPLADPAQPLEVLRTIHSFDPCMSCAVHLLDPDGEELQVVTS